MFITNDDFKIMVKIEHLLMSEDRAKMIKDLDKKGECYFCEEKITNDDINAYWNILERLCIEKDKKNKINSQRIAKKRKHNVFYGRSKQEIERIKRKLEKTNCDLLKEGGK